jgi:hypothetical protein
LAFAINQRPVSRDASSIAQTDVQHFADEKVMRNSRASLLRLVVLQFLPDPAAYSLGFQGEIGLGFSHGRHLPIGQLILNPRFSVVVSSYRCCHLLPHLWYTS